MILMEKGRDVMIPEKEENRCDSGKKVNHHDPGGEEEPS